MDPSPQPSRSKVSEFTKHRFLSPPCHRLARRTLIPSLPLSCLSFHLCQMEARKLFQLCYPWDPTPTLSCVCYVTLLQPACL